MKQFALMRVIVSLNTSLTNREMVITSVRETTLGAENTISSLLQSTRSMSAATTPQSTACGLTHTMDIIQTIQKARKGNDPETIYAVMTGKRFGNRCCFDYGNSEADDKGDGAGAMEAIFFWSFALAREYGLCRAWLQTGGKVPIQGG